MSRLCRLYELLSFHDEARRLHAFATSLVEATASAANVGLVDLDESRSSGLGSPGGRTTIARRDSDAGDELTPRLFSAREMLAMPVCALLDWTQLFRGCCICSDDTATAFGTLLVVAQRLSLSTPAQISQSQKLILAQQQRQQLFGVHLGPATALLSPTPASSAQPQPQSGTLQIDAVSSSEHTLASMLAPPVCTIIAHRGSARLSEAGAISGSSLLLAVDILLHKCNPQLHDKLRSLNVGIASCVWAWLVDGLIAAVPWPQPSTAARWVLLQLASGAWSSWLRIAVSILCSASSDLMLVHSGAEATSYLRSFPRRGILAPTKLKQCMVDFHVHGHLAVSALVLASSLQTQDEAALKSSHCTPADLYAHMLEASSEAAPGYQPSHEALQMQSQFRQLFGFRHRPLIGSFPSSLSRPHAFSPLPSPPPIVARARRASVPVAVTHLSDIAHAGGDAAELRVSPDPTAAARATAAAATAAAPSRRRSSVIGSVQPSAPASGRTTPDLHQSQHYNLSTSTDTHHQVQHQQPHHVHFSTTSTAAKQHDSAVLASNITSAAVGKLVSTVAAAGGDQSLASNASSLHLDAAAGAAASASGGGSNSLFVVPSMPDSSAQHQNFISSPGIKQLNNSSKATVKSGITIARHEIPQIPSSIPGVSLPEPAAFVKLVTERAVATASHRNRNPSARESAGADGSTGSSSNKSHQDTKPAAAGAPSAAAHQPPPAHRVPGQRSKWGRLSNAMPAIHAMATADAVLGAAAATLSSSQAHHSNAPSSAAAAPGDAAAASSFHENLASQKQLRIATSALSLWGDSAKERVSKTRSAAAQAQADAALQSIVQDSMRVLHMCKLDNFATSSAPSSVVAVAAAAPGASAAAASNSRSSTRGFASVVEPLVDQSLYGGNLVAYSSSVRLPNDAAAAAGVRPASSSALAAHQDSGNKNNSDNSSHRHRHHLSDPTLHKLQSLLLSRGIPASSNSVVAQSTLSTAPAAAASGAGSGVSTSATLAASALVAHQATWHAPTSSSPGHAIGSGSGSVTGPASTAVSPSKRIADLIASMETTAVGEHEHPHSQVDGYADANAAGTVQQTEAEGPGADSSPLLDFAAVAPFQGTTPRRSAPAVPPPTAATSLLLATPSAPGGGAYGGVGVIPPDTPAELEFAQSWKPLAWQGGHGQGQVSANQGSQVSGSHGVSDAGDGIDDTTRRSLPQYQQYGSVLRLESVTAHIPPLSSSHPIAASMAYYASGQDMYQGGAPYSGSADGTNTSTGASLASPAPVHSGAKGAASASRDSVVRTRLDSLFSDAITSAYPYYHSNNNTSSNSSADLFHGSEAAGRGAFAGVDDQSGAAASDNVVGAPPTAAGAVAVPPRARRAPPRAPQPKSASVTTDTIAASGVLAGSAMGQYLESSGTGNNSSSGNSSSSSVSVPGPAPSSASQSRHGEYQHVHQHESTDAAAPDASVAEKPWFLSRDFPIHSVAIGAPLNYLLSGSIDHKRLNEFSSSSGSGDPTHGLAVPHGADDARAENQTANAAAAEVLEQAVEASSQRDQTEPVSASVQTSVDVHYHETPKPRLMVHDGGASAGASRSLISTYTPTTAALGPISSPSPVSVAASSSAAAAAVQPNASSLTSPGVAPGSIRGTAALLRLRSAELGDKSVQAAALTSSSTSASLQQYSFGGADKHQDSANIHPASASVAGSPALVPAHEVPLPATPAAGPAAASARWNAGSTAVDGVSGVTTTPMRAGAATAAAGVAETPAHVPPIPMPATPAALQAQAQAQQPHAQLQRGPSSRSIGDVQLRRQLAAGFASVGATSSTAAGSLAQAPSISLASLPLSPSMVLSPSTSTVDGFDAVSVTAGGAIDSPAFQYEFQRRFGIPVAGSTAAASTAGLGTGPASGRAGEASATRRMNKLAASSLRA